MGYAFAAALVKKTGGTAPATRKAFRVAMENLGYRKAASAEEAALTLRMYHDKKSAWLSLAMDMPESLDAEMEFLRKVAVEMRTPILYFMNFDSDFLYIAATDGKNVQHVHVGWIDEEDEAMEDSDELSLFDALLPDDAARAEFRRILAVDDEERVFSEEAAQEMAALFGYTPEVLFIDEDAPPFAEFNFDLPGESLAGGGEDVPFLMPEDALPAFTTAGAVLGWGNPASLSIHPCGGQGRGIRVVMKADGYDAEDWKAACARLSNTLNKNMGHPAPAEYEAKAVPRRVAFQDGGKGWLVEFPDAPVFRGVNPASPMAHTLRADAVYGANGYTLWLVFTGGKVQSNVVNMTEKTHVWVMPMENPAGAIHHTIPRQHVRMLPWWCETDDTSD